MYLPGQGIPLHDLDSRLTPGQSFPPKAGRGSVHVRTRCCVPVPHVVEHGSQSFQSLHSPSTVEEINSKFSEIRTSSIKKKKNLKLYISV